VLPFSLAGFTEACVWPCNVDGTERTLVGGGYVPNSPGSIVVTSGKAFAGDNSATVEVPLVSGAAVSLTAGNPASGLVLDTTTGTIWALDENTACCGLNGTVTRIDAPTDAVLGSPITVGVHPIFVVVG
jgi:DNA-binding beta-propeller fold protein YncE